MFAFYFNFIFFYQRMWWCNSPIKLIHKDVKHIWIYFKLLFLWFCLCLVGMFVVCWFFVGFFCFLVFFVFWGVFGGFFCCFFVVFFSFYFYFWSFFAIRFTADKWLRIALGYLAWYKKCFICKLNNIHIYVYFHTVIKIKINKRV